MTIQYYYDIEQGTDEWHDIRRGKITASSIKAMLTSKLAIADNETSRRAVLKIASERISGFTEETGTTFSMSRGHDDEVLAREIYSDHRGHVTECGFVTNNNHGVMICCSPDGLAGDDGGIEVKSRLHDLQLKTILDGSVPDEYMAQIQTCMLVTGREWWDFCSFPAFGGGKMMVKRVYPDLAFQRKLVEAAKICEERVQEIILKYEKIIDSDDIILFDAPRREAETNEVRIVL